MDGNAAVIGVVNARVLDIRVGNHARHVKMDGIATKPSELAGVANLGIVNARCK